jgi:hypothetical protein
VPFYPVYGCWCVVLSPHQPEDVSLSFSLSQDSSCASKCGPTGVFDAFVPHILKNLSSQELADRRRP